MTIYTDPEENEDYGFVFPPHGHRPPEIRYPRPHHHHRHHHPLVSAPLGMGPRGPQGETFTFDDLTDEQLAELREDVASVYHRKLESVYTTTGDSTSQIPIPWDNFDPEKDMLFVRIEGLWLHANEYTVSEGNIVLTTPITHAGTAVGITMITTVAMSVEDLESLHGEDGFSPTVSMTRQNNGTLLSITDADGTTSALIPDGATGPTGQTGPVGPAGPQGPKGDKGDKGDVGPVGPKGQKGDKGDKGDAGLQGPKGDTGDQGPQGVTGPVGPQGQKGDTGDTGPAGHDGVSPTARVERVEGGALVTVTDASGTTTAMLNDAEVTEGSITDAMLAPDGIKAQVGQLWGNQLIKELTGEVLTAADAYAEPPVALTMDGKSSQVVTTGKNLFDRNQLPHGYYNGSNGSFVSSNAYRFWRIPVSEGDVIRTSGAGVGLGCGFYNGEYVTSIQSSELIAGYVVPAGIDEVADNFSLSASNTAIVTLNNADLTYEPYSGGRPSPSPDWPQPIESVDAPSLHALGVNWLDLDAMTTGYRTDNIGGIVGGTNYKVSDFIPVPPNTDFYVYHALGTSYGYGVWQYDATKVPIKLTNSSGRYTNASFTTEANCRYVRVSTYLDQVDCYLVLGTTTTEYVPYDPASFAVTLPVTLRSLPDGTKDTLSLTYLRPSTREGWAWYGRTLVQNIQRVTFDETENWRAYSYTSGAGYYTTTKVRDHYGHMKLCNMAISASNGAAGKNTCYFGGAGEVNMVGVADSAPTLADWLALVAATPVIVDYYLTTPVTTTLDPIELPVLPAPDVTVWADPSTGLQMEYVRDTNLVVSSLNAETAIAYASIAAIDGPTATTNHAVGTYLTMGGKLYKVTTAIAAGETIAAGTNVTQTTVMDELIAHTA